MGYTDLRLKVRHFIRKYKKIVFIAICIWGIIVLINYMLKNKKVEPIATTTYEPHVSVMSQTSSTPKAMRDPIEKLIKQYVDYCNEQDYENAFYFLSKECREYKFNNDIEEFLTYVLTKLPGPREYSIQNYSNFTIDGKRVYVYDVKYTEDILATGLTDTQYYYTSDKMAFYEDKDGNIQMSIGGYIYQRPIQSIAENEYLKIDIIKKVVNYETESYEVKFTNRCEHTVVIADGYGNSEAVLQLNQEVRNRIEQGVIVLDPGESQTRILTFDKFVDDGDSSNALIFGSIRVMENYSGTEGIEEEIIKSEIENSLAKFSMTVAM